MTATMRPLTPDDTGLVQATLAAGAPGTNGYHQAVYDRWGREWPEVLAAFEHAWLVTDEVGLVGLAGVQRHPIPYSEGASRALVDHFPAPGRPVAESLPGLVMPLAAWARDQGYARLTLNMEPEEPAAHAVLAGLGLFPERVAMFCDVAPTEPESRAIRPMKPDERPLIVRMGTAIAQDLLTYPGALSAPPEATMRTLTEQAYADYGATREHTFLIAQGEEAPVGFLFAVMDSPEVGLIFDLYVEPSYRGQGIARALYVSAARWLVARGATWLTLSVFHDNPARRLYERWGFFPYFMAWELNL